MIPAQIVVTEKNFQTARSYASLIAPHFSDTDEKMEHLARALALNEVIDQKPLLYYPLMERESKPVQTWLIKWKIMRDTAPKRLDFGHGYD